MENSTILEIKDLSVSYTSSNKEIKAVRGLDLAIRQGETLGLVGETGAGKTTTALSVLRILPEVSSSINSGGIGFIPIDCEIACDARGLIDHHSICDRF